MSDVKQVIVVRKDTDPPMRKGKVGAQCGHAVISFLLNRMKKVGKRKYEITLTEEEEAWKEESQAKICLGVESEEELLEIFQRAKQSGLEVKLVKDSGKTEFKEPTITCLAIGPDLKERIDQITGHLKPL